MNNPRNEQWMMIYSLQLELSSRSGWIEKDIERFVLGIDFSGIVRDPVVLNDKVTGSEEKRRQNNEDGNTPHDIKEAFLALHHQRWCSTSQGQARPPSPDSANRRAP